MASDSLGYAHRQLGHLSDAIASHRQAVALWQRLGDHYDEARTLENLGDVHHDGADPQAAQEAWQRALPILAPLAGPDAERIRSKLASLRSPQPERPA